MTNSYEAQAARRADTPAMLRWAKCFITQRGTPDVLLHVHGKPYLERWFVVPRNDVMNVYLHRFVASDEDRALHDHRGENRSWLLEGEYLEHTTTDAPQLLCAGDSISRGAEQLHRVELIDGKPALSLFFIGPIVRDWGFKCPDGRYVPWQEFLHETPGNEFGKGCG